MLQPALLGGVVIGVLSALPVINLANCCCGWILFGGGLAAYLMQQGRATPISAGDGALVGLMAGAIGAVVWTLVAIPLSVVADSVSDQHLDRACPRPDMPPEARAFLESARQRASDGGHGHRRLLRDAVRLQRLRMIGGLFGALFFRKNAPPPPPPPIAGADVHAADLHATAATTAAAVAAARLRALAPGQAIVGPVPNR